MPLATGAKLGHYEILAPIGAGGMGEVYRARDPRLGRDVALKVLPRDVMSDPERRRRFEQEARTASALNHPNILTVFDIGEDAGMPYLVSELVDGESLRSIVQRGAVPSKKLVEIAAQIADGLQAAHAAPVVHRDIKPDNILLTRDGRPKIVDFGLARSSSPIGPDEATRTQPLTSEGVVRGTASYMSPEQARGERVDFRSDQFSFGIVLYEMATGRKPFDRDTGAETLVAILRDDAPELGSDVAAPLRWVIERCLEKDPRNRYGSTRDLFHDLRRLRDRLTEPVSEAVSSVAGKNPARSTRWLIPAAAALAAGLVLGLLVAPRPRQTSFSFRPIATEPRVQREPVWSPDGKALIYESRRKITMRAVDGSSVVDLGPGRFPRWSRDGTRVFFTRPQTSGISSVSVSGGEARSEFQWAETPAEFDISRDGKTLVAWKSDGEKISVVVASPPDGEPKPYSGLGFTAVLNTTRLRISPDGKRLLVYHVASGDLWVAPLPPREGQPPRKAGTFMQASGVTWMPDSRRVLISRREEFTTVMTAINVDSGQQEMMWSGLGAVGGLSVAGDKIAFDTSNVDLDAVAIPLDGGPEQPIRQGSDQDQDAIWSGDGGRIIFVSDRSGTEDLWTGSDGQDSDRRLLSIGPSDSSGLPEGFKADHPSLSRDGKRLVFTSSLGLWLVPANGGRPVNTGLAGRAATWSPDGRWLAFRDYSTSKRRLVKALADGDRSLIELAPDTFANSSPQWSPRGDWIAYASRDATMLVSPDGSRRKEIARPAVHQLAWSPDGAKLYAVRGQPGESIVAIDVGSGRESTVRALPSGFVFGSALASLSPDGKRLLVTRQTS